MATKQVKNLNTLMQEARTFPEGIAFLVAHHNQIIRNLQPWLKKRGRTAIADRPTIEQSIRYHESELRKLEARRQRYEQYQGDKKIPAALRKQIAKLETEILRREHDASYQGCLRFRKQELAKLFEQADQIGNPPKPLTTTNKAFRVGRKYPSQSITRAYDGYVWDVLKGHFERLPREKGERTSFKIVAPLPEKDEYLQLKERHFTRTLETLVDEGYGIVDELQGELQDAYENMPEGLQGSAVGEARLQAADELGIISGNQPVVPESVSSLRIVHYPSPNQNRRADRAYEATIMLRSASAAVQEYRKSQTKLKKADARELDEFCQQLENHADEVEGVEFPGMFG